MSSNYRRQSNNARSTIASNWRGSSNNKPIVGSNSRPKHQVGRPTATVVNQNTLGGPSSNSNSANQLQLSTGDYYIPNMIHAPTSLTNLAQLSGITIMPIDSVARSHKPNQQPAAMDQHAQQTTTASSISSLQSMSMPRLHTQPSLAASNRIGYALDMQGPSPAKQGRTSSLASIPSVQLLSQNWPTSETSNWTRAPKVRGLARDSMETAQNNRQTIYDQSLDRSRVKGSTPSNPHGKSSVKPNPAPYLVQQQAMSDFDKAPEQNTNPTNDQTQDISNEQYNMSLLKLMAILNNPALSIIPVETKPNTAQTSMDAHTSTGNKQPGNSRSSNTHESKQIKISGLKTNLARPIQQQQQQSNCDGRDDLSAKIRLPQSAANLQIVHSNKKVSLKNAANNNRACGQGSYLRHEPSQKSGVQLSWSANSSNVSMSDTNPNQRVGPSLEQFGDDNDDIGMDDSLNSVTSLSASVDNLAMQRYPNSNKTPTLSVHLLRHIANQNGNESWPPETQNQNKSVPENECVLSVSKDIPELPYNVAKELKKIFRVTSTPLPTKGNKKPVRSTRSRLYVTSETSKVQIGDFNPEFSVDVDAIGQKELHVSDQHFILESMMPESDEMTNLESTIPEPDDIFVNRSKRVMSKIDTMLERKKRRRFERISARAAPRSSSLEEQCAESELEWSDDENSLETFKHLRIQLPLDEPLTDEKRTYLSQVGLIGRAELHNHEAEACENRLKLFTPTVFEEDQESFEDLSRFVGTILKTGGTDVQLRVESNIKRMDLPLIEGLNRSTSRAKVAYMNVLGLDKRSKRTTLYKVKPLEGPLVTKAIDLNRAKNAITHNQPRLIDTNNLSKLIISTRLLAENGKANKLPKVSLNCRESLKPVSKDEYMKSLGLMAS